MSELIIFSLNAIVVYLLSDWILRMIEKRRGEILKHRQVVYFLIFAVLIAISFGIINLYIAPA